MRGLGRVYARLGQQVVMMMTMAVMVVAVTASADRYDDNTTHCLRMLTVDGWTAPASPELDDITLSRRPGIGCPHDAAVVVLHAAEGYDGGMAWRQDD